MNQYHKDYSTNEMLKFLDNAHGIFLNKYGVKYPVVGARLEALYHRILIIVTEESK